MPLTRLMNKYYGGLLKKNYYTGKFTTTIPGEVLAFKKFEVRTHNYDFILKKVAINVL